MSRVEALDAAADEALIDRLRAAGCPGDVAAETGRALSALRAQVPDTVVRAAKRRAFLEYLAMTWRGAGFAVEALCGEEFGPAWIEPTVAELWRELGEPDVPRGRYVVREHGDSGALISVALADGRRVSFPISWPAGVPVLVRGLRSVLDAPDAGDTETR